MPTPVADYLIFPAQNRTPSVKTPRRKLLFLDSDMELKTVDPEGNVELLGGGTPGPAGAKGETGDQGPIGPAGSSGSPGTAATVEVNSTTTGLPGTDAEVVNVGTSSAALLDFTIPAGEDGTDGTAATIAVGTVTTGAAGSSAAIVNAGTSSAAVFNFTIPRGDMGASSPVVVIVDQKTAGTNGGVFLSGGWRTRDLNTIRLDTSTGASVVVNQFSLPTGTWMVEASSPGYVVARHQIRLRNVTTSTTEITGASAYSSITNASSSRSVLAGALVVANAAHKYEIQHQCSSSFTSPPVGMGESGNFGETEVYTVMVLTKIS